jgi:hypothetical protein
MRSTFCHTFMLRIGLQPAVFYCFVPKKSRHVFPVCFDFCKNIVWYQRYGAKDAFYSLLQKSVVPPSGNINKCKYCRQEARHNQCFEVKLADSNIFVNKIGFKRDNILSFRPVQCVIITQLIFYCIAFDLI